MLVLTGEVEWVIAHFEHLQLVVQLLQVLHGFVMLSHEVLAKRKHVELLQVVEALDD